MCKGSEEREKKFHEGPRMSCKIIFLPLRKQGFEDLLTVILTETHCPTLPVPHKKNTKT